MTRARLGFVGVGTALYVAVMIGFVFVSSRQSSQLESSWTPEGPCTVRLSGHDMNATAQGSGALATCKAWLHGGSAASPGGDHQCSYARNELTITVRDSGHAVYGSAYCTHLESWSTDGGPVPDIEGDSLIPVLTLESPSPAAR